MKFGPIPVEQAAGAILAHATRTHRKVLKKGRLLDSADLAELLESDILSVVAARLEPGDIDEDSAAIRAAASLIGKGVCAPAGTTGRVNLHASIGGMLVFDSTMIGRLNQIDESITVATLPPYIRVSAHQMVATIKVIPYSAPDSVVTAWEAMALPLRVEPLATRRFGLLQTVDSHVKASTLQGTVDVTRRRIETLGSRLAAEEYCPHDARSVADSLKELLTQGCNSLLMVGASAIIDRRDVLPSGVALAGGRIACFGMPVDPGNLLMVAAIGDIPVLGLPGCARSPKLNGFDWVLERQLAGLPVGRAEIALMGVGGLLSTSPASKPAIPDGNQLAGASTTGLAHRRADEPAWDELP